MLRVAPTSIMFLLDWLNQDVRGKVWIIASETAFLVSSYVITHLSLRPFFSYYSESTYLGDFANDIIFGVLIGYVAMAVAVPKFRKALRKRYIIVFKIIFLPVAYALFSFISNKPFYKETIHDLPRKAE